MRHYTPLTPEEAAERLRIAVSHRSWIIFLAECLVEYEGRAASRTSYGDKLVMIKPDGSVIVHGPRGLQPQNWQPDTVAVTVECEEKQVIFKAVRGKPREVLVMKCPVVYDIILADEPVEGEYWMYLNEHQIRDALAENPHLLEEGLRIKRVEKPVEPGFIDLYGVDSSGRLVVVELKRIQAGEEAVRQLLRYVEAFEKRGIKVRPILAAPDFTDAARALAARSGVELKRLDLKRLYELVKGRRRRSQGSLANYL